MLTIRNALRVTGRPRGVKALSFAVLAAALLGAGAFAVVLVASSGETPARAGDGGPAETIPAATAATSPAGTPTSVPRTPTATVPAGPPPSLEEAHRLLREGEFVPAAAAFQAAAAVAGGAARAAALTGEANAWTELGENAKAADSLRAAVGAAPAGSAEAVRARYLLGRQLVTARDFTGARDVLAPVLSAASPLSPYVAFEYGRALEGAGDTASAALAYERAATASAPVALRVSALRALAGIAAGPVAKVTAYERERAVRETAGLLSLLATAQAEAGDEVASHTTLRVLAARYPGSAAALESVRKLRLADAALDAGEEGLVFYRHGRLADARRVLEGAGGEAGIPADALGVRWYYLGATYEDLDLRREAVAAYDQAATLANAAFRHRARYWAARVTESMDDAPGASARYRGVVAAGGGEFAAESAFRAGYVLLAAGDAPGAIAAWSETGSAGGARALYWKGRALNLIGRATEARAAWEEARRIDPMSLYAHESARELGTGGLPATAYRPLPADTAIDWDAIERWLTTAAGARTGTLDVAIARELAAAGLHADAEDALLDAATTPWEQFDAMRAARDMGLPAPAVQLAFRLAGRYPDPDGVLTRIEYPLAFVRTLDAEARARNLDPLFLAALIRQESLWDEKAGSTAGALGLTQVIPPTGQAIAGELGVSAFRAEDLFRPSVALRFGAYYIAAQIAKYGTPWAALSAYNAGPGAADRWTRAAGRAAAADYIEAVDYSETHAYVAYVLNHYARYTAEYR